MTRSDSRSGAAVSVADAPGPDGLPLLGNTRAFVDDPLGFYVRTAREYGPIARYRVGGYEFVQLSDPEYVEHVLVHNNQAYVKGERFQESLRPVLGNGLLTSHGEFWRSQRHTIEPAFHPDALERYGAVMTDLTEQHAAAWTDGEVRNVHADMMSLTVEIAAKALFDIDVREQEEEIADALETVMDYTARSMRRPIDVPEWIPTPGNRAYRQAVADIRAVADRIIDRKRAAGIEDASGIGDVARIGDAAGNGDTAKVHPDESDAESPPDVVSLLLSADDPPSREQIRDEVVTLLLAGHETTALALTYTLQLLSENPEKRARLQDELDEVLGDRLPTVADLDELTYTERVVKEGMRVYPPVQGLIRESAADDVIGGYRIPEGTSVTFQQWVLHRDPRFYDDPEAFRPERWTDDFEADLPAFAYFPFGGGPRRCIGDRFAMMEARLVLATLLREWELETTVDDLSFAPSITNRPDGPVEMVTNRRE